MAADGATVLTASAAIPERLSELFARYNPAVWPGHVVAYGLIVVVLALVLLRPCRGADRAAAGLLAAAWLWLGVVFFGIFATRANPVLGVGYAALFILQAAALLRAGVLRSDLRFRARNGLSGIVGWLALGYALAVYPLLGVALGHGYPEAPLFGMAPCPTTIATFGLLLLARAPLPRHLLAIPLGWAVLGPLAAVPQGMAEDIGLLVVGACAVLIVLSRDRRRSPRPSPPLPDRFPPRGLQPASKP